MVCVQLIKIVDQVFVACGFDHGKSVYPVFSNTAKYSRSCCQHVLITVGYHAPCQREYFLLFSGHGIDLTTFPSSPLITTSRSEPYITTVDLVGKKLTWLLYRSLIAAYLGNIIGALFVGLPAVYFYLGDWTAGGLRNAEEAQVEKRSDTSSEDK